MQASRWIKEKESRRKKLAVHTFNDADFVKRLELSIQFGNPFLFEGILFMSAINKLSYLLLFNNGVYLSIRC